MYECFTQFCNSGRIKLCLCPETGSSYCGWGGLSASHSYIPFCPHCLAFAVRLAQLTNSSCRLAKGLERWSLVIQAVAVWHLCTLSVTKMLLHLKKGTQVCVSAAPVHSPLASNSVEVGVNLNARLKAGAGETGAQVPFPQQWHLGEKWDRQLWVITPSTATVVFASVPVRLSCRQSCHRPRAPRLLPQLSWCAVI